MLSDLTPVPKYVGIKQSVRAIESGKVKKAYIAYNAESKVTEPLVDACKKHYVEYEFVPTMNELGRACGIDVGASVVTILK